MTAVEDTEQEPSRRYAWHNSSLLACVTLLAVRNSFRKLPFHLARERGLQQLMSLVDPRIPIDVALDAARWAEQ